MINKNCIWFSLIILLSGCKQKYDVVRKIPKQKLTPPGTIWLRENLFIDKAEVSNIDYIEFLYYLNRRKRESEYLAMKPDSFVWYNDSFNNIISNSRSYKLTYYQTYPIIGVTFLQAKKYCEFRTEVVNLSLYIPVLKKQKIKYNPDSNYVTPQIVKFRLPTKDEWIYAASGGLKLEDYSLGYEIFTDKKRHLATNTREYYNYHKEKFKFKYDKKIQFLWPSYSGRPNKFGIYNMLGNASEIIADSLVMGLSYINYLDGSVAKGAIFDYQFLTKPNDSTSVKSLKQMMTFPGNNYNISKSLPYYTSTPWTGFRCICEILKP